jgi:hypothetical protein
VESPEISTGPTYNMPRYDETDIKPSTCGSGIYVRYVYPETDENIHTLRHNYEANPDDIIPLLVRPPPNDDNNARIFSNLRQIEKDYDQARDIHNKKTDDIVFLKKIISLLEADKVKLADELRQLSAMHTAIDPLLDSHNSHN